MMGNKKMDRSKALFRDATRYIPGGVNSPVRAFGSVGTDPVFMEKAAGSRLTDADGNEYIDYIGSWGPALLGHSHPVVVRAVKKALDDGFSFGTLTEKETRLARLVTEMVPSIEMVRFVSSGTEACMSALRLARGATGRDRIIKFNGCYHGHGDMLLVKAGSGVATLGIPGSPGVPAGATRDTLVAPFNDSNAVRRLCEDHAGEVAAVIIEPIVGNAGFIRPETGFLEELRKICDEHGALLIFDEVMTGFRVARGGVQELSGVRPDLTTLGKVIGGGMPIGAYGGRREIMEKVAPSGPVYQAGTLSGNPVAMTCGIETLQLVDEVDYDALGERCARLINGFIDAARTAGIALSGDWQGGMFGFNFSPERPRNFDEAAACDVESFNRFFRGM